MAYDKVPLFSEVQEMNNINVGESMLEDLTYKVRWRRVWRMYNRVAQEYEDIRLKWWVHKVSFEADGWKCGTFPEFEKIVYFKFEDLKYTNPREAQRVLKEALDELEIVAKDRLETKRQDAISFARRQWLKMIANTAGAKSMITLQRKDFQPSPEAENIFRHERKCHHEHAIIVDEGFKVKMICFPASRVGTIDDFRLKEFSPSTTKVVIS